MPDGAASIELALWRDPAGQARTRFAAEVRTGLLRAAYSRLPESAEGATVERNQWGKPVIEGAHLSLTHCGPWLAAAASRERIGIDIEVETERNFSRIARRLEWPQQVEPMSTERFYELWTIWEAALKAQRREARRLMASLPEVLAPTGTHPFSRQGVADGWWAATGHLVPGMAIALVGRGALGNITVTHLAAPPPQA